MNRSENQKIIDFIKIQFKRYFPKLISLKSEFKETPTFQNYLKLHESMLSFISNLIFPKITLNKIIKVKLLDDDKNIIFDKKFNFNLNEDKIINEHIDKCLIHDLFKKIYRKVLFSVESDKYKSIFDNIMKTKISGQWNDFIDGKYTSSISYTPGTVSVSVADDVTFTIFSSTAIYETYNNNGYTGIVINQASTSMQFTSLPSNPVSLLAVGCGGGPSSNNCGGGGGGITYNPNITLTTDPFEIYVINSGGNESIPPPPLPSSYHSSSSSTPPPPPPQYDGNNGASTTFDLYESYGGGGAIYKDNKGGVGGSINTTFGGGGGAGGSCTGYNQLGGMNSIGQNPGNNSFTNNGLPANGGSSYYSNGTSIPITVPFYSEKSTIINCGGGGAATSGNNNENGGGGNGIGGQYLINSNQSINGSTIANSYGGGAGSLMSFNSQGTLQQNYGHGGGGVIMLWWLNEE